MRAFILLLLVNLLVGCGAPKSAVEIVPDSDILYRQGVAAVRSGQLEKAKQIFEKSLERDSTYLAPSLGLAEIAYQQSEYNLAAEYLDRILSDNTQELYTEALFLRGLVAWEQQDYSASQETFGLYVQQSPARPQRDQAAKYLRDSRVHIKSGIAPGIATNCELKGVNTTAPEYLPTIPAHEEFMIFTRRLSGQEDLFQSELVDSNWTEARPLTDINTSENEGAHTVSVDGNTLVFTRCGSRDGVGSCDLYFSTFRDGRWSSAQNLGAEINSTSWDAQPCFSPNMRRLYFASERPGGRGGRDIWYVDRTAQGWSTAQNLSAVNTSDNDESPFLHPDGEHLYFMSQGHPGYGGYDLFVAFEGQNKNLGPAINSTADEGSMHVMLDGKTGYYARSQVVGRRLMDSDICEVILPPEVRSRPTTFLELKVFDEATDSQIDANVRIVDSMNARTTLYSAFANRRNIYTLPSGSNYSLQIDRPGYSFYSERFRLESSNTITKPFFLDISLKRVNASIEEAEPILLENVFYAIGSAELLESSYSELDFLVRKMKAEPQVALEIRGHTDDIGEEDSNQVLSEERAKAVYDYLIKKGISASRLTYVGFGESVPIASNETESGRAQNRRTELKIFKK